MNIASQQLVLASASPRRRRILQAMALDFEAVSPDVCEASHHPDSPRALVLHNAALKSQAGAAMLDVAQASLVVGADTIVVLDGHILGKPPDRAGAEDMLAKLSGHTHEVYTGLALQAHPKGALWLDAEVSYVTFRKLEPELIQRYVDSGEADDKAGSYGIQGDGGGFIENVSGDLSNVIGLPLSTFSRGMTLMAGYDPLAGRNRKGIIERAFPGLSPRLLEFCHPS